MGRQWVSSISNGSGFCRPAPCSEIRASVLDPFESGMTEVEA
jgi:hypothetical protein